MTRQITITKGMRFQHRPLEAGNEFRVEKYDYYDDGNPIWVAVTDRLVLPLDEIMLDNYSPLINGVWVNEPIEYIY